MSTSDELLLLALLIKKRNHKKKKAFGIHPMLVTRSEKGIFQNLFQELCGNDSKFFNYFRMSKKSFFELLTYVKEDITGVDTKMRRSVTPEEKLVVTLRYLATGASMMDLHYQFRLSQPTISGIVRNVCEAIWRRVRPIAFSEFTEKFWLETASGFFTKTGFPNCLGAIDGKQVRVIKPQSSGSLYYNYKNYFSIMLLAVCDANYKFIFIDVGAYGKSADSTVFKDSIFYKKIQDNSLNIPRPTNSLTESEVPMPFVFVADEGFGLSTKILRPYSGKCLNIKQRVFNYRLSRARRNIECSFGILANKWRIFHRPLNVDLSLSENIIKVCCVLHNFVRERDGLHIENTDITVEGLFDVDPASVPQSKDAINLRNYFADYFLTNKGALPWQMDHI